MRTYSNRESSDINLDFYRALFNLDLGLGGPFTRAIKVTPSVHDTRLFHPRGPPLARLTPLDLTTLGHIKHPRPYSLANYPFICSFVERKIIRRFHGFNLSL